MSKRPVSAILSWFIAAMLIFCAACSQDEEILDNYPYEPETPVPDAHEGVFVSEHGTMTFSGDGESVLVDLDKELAQKAGLPEGENEGSYVFLSGDLPPHGSFPVRYDIAHEMKITIGEESSVIDMAIITDDGKSAQFGVDTVTPERIPMLFQTDEGLWGVQFLKEDK